MNGHWLLNQHLLLIFSIVGAAGDRLSSAAKNQPR